MTVQLVMAPVQAPTDNYALLKNQQQQSTWHIHQSKALTKKGRCCWENCPGKKLSTAKCPRSSDTQMRCKESSTYLGKYVFLCNSFVKGAPVNCHRHYHLYHHNKEFTLTMVIN